MTLDPDKAETVFRRQLGNGILLYTGIENRPGRFLFVVDIDPRNGGKESYRRLLRHLGLKRLPKTPIARTGGAQPGRHYLLLAPYPITSGPLKDFPGIDIKGWGNFVVAPPSINCETGHRYRWLCAPWQVPIADAPGALLTLLKRRDELQPATKPGARLGPAAERKGRKAIDASAAPYRPIAGRMGDPEALAAEMDARFPVPGVGHRHDSLCRSVAYLVGRDYDDQTIIDAETIRHRRLKEQGKVATGAEGNRAELIAVLRSTRSNARFRLAVSGEIDHDQAKATFALGAEATQLINKLILQHHKKTRHRTSADCSKADNPGWLFAWFEAVVVHVAYSWRMGQVRAGGKVLATDEEVRRIALARHPDLPRDEDCRQGRREKDRWINRLVEDDMIRPADNVPLLVEEVKGRNLPGATGPGYPTQYTVTDALRQILDAIEPGLVPSPVTSDSRNGPVARSGAPPLSPGHKSARRSLAARKGPQNLPGP